MDAASHNSVEDVRQINDAIRYAPMSARYKVYILDEVHMLSGAAFNALLKTLEEPPPHAKFIFATTEIRKVPVTVLSRCQRFDLRRVDAGAAGEASRRHRREREGRDRAAALALIARAAEGSVRDSLSLLDQAIAHAAGPVRAEDVRQMLGLADRVRVVDLFEALMNGDMAAALDELREQYEIGADPAVVLPDLAEFTHFVTRVKVIPAVADDVSLSEAERTRGRAFAAKLSMRVLSRTWQMLLKGIAEVQASGRPVAAAEMVLVRIAYAADLPTPDEVVRALSEDGVRRRARPARDGGVPRLRRKATRRAMSAARLAALLGRGVAAPGRRSGGALDEPAATPTLAIARSRIDRARRREARHHHEDGARTRRAAGALRGRPARNRARADRAEDLVHDLQRKLGRWTGKRWIVVVSKEEGAPTMRAQAEAQKAEIERGVQADPLVQAVLNRFPAPRSSACKREETAATGRTRTAMPGDRFG